MSVNGSVIHEKMAMILQAWYCDPCEKSVIERKVCDIKQDFDKINYKDTKSQACKYCKSIKKWRD